MSVIETLANGVSEFTLRFSENEEQWKLYHGESLLLTLFEEEEALAFFETLRIASVYGEIEDLHVARLDEAEKTAYGLVKGRDGRFVTFEVSDTFTLLFRGNEDGARDRFNRCVTPALDVFLRLVGSLGGEVIKVRGRTNDFCTVLAKFQTKRNKVYLGYRWFVMDVTGPCTWSVVETPEEGFTTEAEGLQQFDELTLFK